MHVFGEMREISSDAAYDQCFANEKNDELSAS